MAECPRRALGVCIGAKAAFVAKTGLMKIEMRNVIAAWAV